MAGILIEEDFIVSVGGIVYSRLFRAQAGLNPGKSCRAVREPLFSTTFTEYDGSCTKADWISFSFAVAILSFWFE